MECPGCQLGIIGVLFLLFLLRSGGFLCGGFDGIGTFLLEGFPWSTHGFPWIEGLELFIHSFFSSSLTHFCWRFNSRKELGRRIRRWRMEDGGWNKDGG